MTSGDTTCPAQMSSAREVLAKISPLPGAKQGSKARSPRSSSKSSESSTSCSQSSSSSRTSPIRGAVGCPMCGPPSPGSDTPPCRFACPPLTSALRTGVTESSLLPTPTANAYGYSLGGGAGRKGKQRMSLQSLAARGLLPTPTRTDGVKGGAGGNRNTPSLAEVARGDGGLLHPAFVEWMMSFPPGFTDLDGDDP